MADEYEVKSPITTLMNDVGYLRYEIDEWVAYLRDHVGTGYISRFATAEELNKMDGIRFAGDFFGYLRYKGYKQNADWLHLKLNGMEHPADFNEERAIVYLVPGGLIDEWYRKFAESYNKNATAIAKILASNAV